MTLSKKFLVTLVLWAAVLASAALTVCSPAAPRRPAPSPSASAPVNPHRDCDNLFDDEKWQKAAVCYERAADLEPKTAPQVEPFRSNRAVYRAKSGAAYWRAEKNDRVAGAYAKAVAAYTEAIDLAIENVDYYRNRGLVYMDMGDYAAAAREYTKVIGFGARDCMDYAVRAEAYMKLGNYAAAVSDYEEALEIVKKSGDSGCKELAGGLAAAKAKAGYATITFTSPSVVSRSDYPLAVCVNSEKHIDSWDVKINGRSYRRRGIDQIVDDDGCDLSIDERLVGKIELGEGENVIRAEVSAGGVTNSKEFRVVYGVSAGPDVPARPGAVDGVRVALVMGNAAYRHPLRFPKLEEAANDARLVAAKLKELGFDVSLELDLEKAAMDGAIERFASGKAANADVALFYYAGHGIQSKDMNYFLPLDIDACFDPAVRERGVSMGRLLEALGKSGAKLKIVMADACRNPTCGFRGGGGGVTSSGAAAPRGTLIVYSASNGEAAMDFSVFRRSFLRYVDYPGFEARDLFRRVKEDVVREMKAINAEQTPEIDAGEMAGEFYFKRGGR